MESFTVHLDLKEKTCEVTGSVLGQVFIKQHQDITRNFIDFCAEQYGRNTAEKFKFQFLLRESDLVVQKTNIANNEEDKSKNCLSQVKNSQDGCLSDSKETKRSDKNENLRSDENKTLRLDKDDSSMSPEKVTMRFDKNQTLMSDENKKMKSDENELLMQQRKENKCKKKQERKKKERQMNIDEVDESSDVDYEYNTDDSEDIKEIVNSSMRKSSRVNNKNINYFKMANGIDDLVNETGNSKDEVGIESVSEENMNCEEYSTKMKNLPYVLLEDIYGSKATKNNSSTESNQSNMRNLSHDTPTDQKQKSGSHDISINQPEKKALALDLSTDQSNKKLEKDELESHSKSKLTKSQQKRQPHQSNFKCDICDQKFRNEIKFKRHKLKHVNNKRVQCPLCETTFAEVYSVKKHLKVMHKELRPYCSKCQTLLEKNSDLTGHRHQGQCVSNIDKRFQCVKCNRYFASLQYMYRHYQGKHHLRVSICRFCGKIFKEKSDLVSHVETMHKSTIICNMCKMTFPMEKEFIDHVYSVHKEFIVKCEKCPAIFFSQEKLKLHMVDHTKEYPFNCKTCGKGFKIKRMLKNHMASHDSLRLYQCDRCGKSFKLQTTLSAHKRTHMTDKKYKCSSCDTAYRTIDALKNHEIRNHLTEEELKNYNKKIYTCEFCGKKDGLKHAHDRHVRSHTGEKPFKCSVCSKCFLQRQSLKVHHQRTHEKSTLVSCTLCNKNFNGSAQYKRHLSSKRHSQKSKSVAVENINPSNLKENNIKLDVHSAKTTGVEKACSSTAVEKNTEHNSLMIIDDDSVAENGSLNNTTSTVIIIPENFQNIHELQQELGSLCTVNGETVIYQTGESEFEVHLNTGKHNQ